MSPEVKFLTECFYLAIHAQHLAMNSTIENFDRLKRHMQHILTQSRNVEELLRLNPTGSRTGRYKAEQENLRVWKRKLTAAVMCVETVLYDESLLDRSLEFVNKQLLFLVNSINPN